MENGRTIMLGETTANPALALAITTQIAAWHSPGSRVYHDDTGCTEGNSIEPKDRRQGTGAKEKCWNCKRLQRNLQREPAPRRSSPSMGR